MMIRRALGCVLLALLAAPADPLRLLATTDGISPPLLGTASCFLLFEFGVGEVRRNPSEACRSAISPASTFKVPHALAALDSGVVAGPSETFVYDGKSGGPEAWRRDHTLATAMRYSVLWYFQRIAQRLGADREREYLKRLAYGNMDSTSGLTTFWLGESLQVTPDEQERFWVNLYKSNLPISERAMEQVRAMLVQPTGTVVNASGAHPFVNPWPADAVVSAKTGSVTDKSGRAVRWLAAHVKRGRRSFVFVSCVIGSTELEANAAIDLAARSLREAHVL
jgi:beta-lactamase class D